jgi:hypothetical protein
VTLTPAVAATVATGVVASALMMVSSFFT